MQILFKSTTLKCLLLFIMGSLTVFAFAPFNHFLLLFLPLLFFVGVVSSSQNLDPNPKPLSLSTIYLYGYSFGGGYFASQIYWIFYSLYEIIQAGFWVSLIAQILFVGYLAFFITLTIWLFTRFSTSSRFFNLVILFPSSWVISEWLRGWLFTGFPWCEVGYALSYISIFRGIYPLIGNYGVSWIGLSIVGVIIYILTSLYPLKISDFSKTTNLFKALIYLSIIFTLSFFLKNINYTLQAGPPIKVALIQGNIPQNVKWDNSNYALNVYATEVAKAEAGLIILPETAIPRLQENLPIGYLGKLRALSKLKHEGLVVGMPRIIDANMDYVNAAIVLTDPRLSYYAKYHLVPYGEYIPFKWLLTKVYAFVNLPMVGFTPGAFDQTPLNVSGQKIAFDICYENGFGSELIHEAKNSVLLANLSDMAWYGNSIAKDEHLQISQVRALENQRYFLQTTNTGLTAIINPYGKIESELFAFKRDILTGYVIPRFGITPFEKFGNYPIILFCIIILLLAFLSKVFKRNK